MSQPNKTDLPLDTKQCTDCGVTIIRTYESKSRWKHTIRCGACHRAMLDSRTNDARVGNVFWKALSFGEIPQSLRQRYELRKKAVRNLQLVGAEP